MNFPKNSRNKKSDKSSSKSAGRDQHKSFPSRGNKPKSGDDSRTLPRAAGRGAATESVSKAWRMIAGTHAIRECLNVRPDSIKMAIFDRNWNSQGDLREIYEVIKAKRITIEERSSGELEKVCYSHQGCVIYSSYIPHFDVHEQTWSHNSLIVALDGVEDPHNLGAVLRTSWLTSAAGLIIPSDRAVGLTATVHKVACGGVEHVPVLTTQNFAEAFKPLKEAGFWVFGLSHKAKKTIYDLKMPEKVIWVLGAEDKGMRITTERACDELVSLPQVSADASYNVSVAAGMALAETKRQWR